MRLAMGSAILDVFAMLSRLQNLANATIRNAATPLIAVMIGVVSFCVAVTATALSPEGTRNLVAVIGFWIAQTVIGAGVVVGVMRALQSADYFEFGLRRILYDSDLPDGPIDYDAAWRGLTIGLIRRRFSSLEAAKGDLKPGGLIGDDEYYYAAHKRFVRIGWQDRAKAVIRISDRVEAILQTGDIGGPVRFGNWFTPDADSSKRRSVICRFSGAFTRTLGETDMAMRDGRHGFEIELPPSSTITMIREFEKEQDLDDDPILNYTSSSLVHSPRVDIRCEPGLRFYFRKMGTAGNFAVEGANVELDGPLSEVVAQYDGLCFRNQGYIIVVVKE